MQARALQNYHLPVKNDSSLNVLSANKLKTAKKSKKSKFLLKIGFFLFLYALLLVYLCIKGSALGYQLVQLEGELQKIETANHRLVFAIAEKSSLQRIEWLAVSELSMYKPQPEESITVAASSQPPVLVTGEQNRSGILGEKDEKWVQKIYNTIIQTAQNLN